MELTAKNSGFDNRIRSRAEALSLLPLKPLSIESTKEVIGQQSLDSNELILYIHIPFCKQNCSFCVYSKIQHEDTLVEKYIRIIETQIEESIKLIPEKKSPVSAIYFGGGSPSSISTQYITDILDKIAKNFPIKKSCEITLECTAKGINTDLLQFISNSPINRISIGVQSFNTKIRQSIGRISPKDELISKISNTREILDNIYVDIIYGLAGQKEDDLYQDLLSIEKLSLAGCSLYPLIDFSKQTNAKEEDWNYTNREFQLYKEADNFFHKNLNWKCLTPHQYSNSEKGSSIYVHSTACNANVLAFGCASGGKLGKIRYFSNRDITKFIDSAQPSFLSSAKMFTVEDSFLPFENLLKLAEANYIESNEVDMLPEKFQDSFNQLVLKELVEKRDNYFHLTQKGRFWSANIASYLIENILKFTKEIPHHE